MPRAPAPSWSVVLALTLATLAGCLGADPGSEDDPGEAVRPTGPGWVRLVHGDGALAPEARLVGFPLELHPDDWSSTGLWSETRIAIAPYGNVTGWAIFLFEEGRLAYEVIDMPYELLRYDTGERVRHEAGRSPALAWVFAEEPVAYDAVVAIFGSGTLALAPSPTWPVDDPPSSDELRNLSTAAPPIVGTGVGMWYHAHVDQTIMATGGGQFTFGTPEVAYAAPLPSDQPSPALDLRVTTPPGPAAWASNAARYRADGAQGSWEATIEAGSTHELGGPILQHRTVRGIGLVEEMVLGQPHFMGDGAVDGAPRATFHVTATNADTTELYGLQQVTFGTPLEALIGRSAPEFTLREFPGMAPRPGPPAVPGLAGVSLQGDDLVLDSPWVRTVLVDAFPE